MASDRMFRVIVLGGIALVGGTGCSAAVDPDASTDARPDSFPSELPVQVDAGRDTGSDAQPDAFPAELPQPPDAAPDAFPAELPVQIDAGSADAGEDGCFPSETALPQDC